ncbi:hemerythrin domain-containing protein [Haloechinothrix halophila]|uniref:hemerythrin domain-containing protein n=1 Tax=Haloechinothrix halophila TaxID=1069073 RepID=UPI00040A6198|nr:hemerythrin domain-containing protein [Haloechinothrix halophila]
MSTTQQFADDLIHAIIRDHRDLERVFSEIERHNHSLAYRKDLVDHVIADLVRHSVAEEQFVYPVARDRIEDGDEIVDHEIAEHTRAERLMKELEPLDASDPRFDDVASQLIDDVRHHFEDEERDLLPALRSRCSEAELRDLGGKVIVAKDSAPTRPHPGMPDRPPANLVLDAGVSIIDKVRDALHDRRV